MSYLKPIKEAKKLKTIKEYVREKSRNEVKLLGKGVLMVPEEYTLFRITEYGYKISDPSILSKDIILGFTFELYEGKQDFYPNHLRESQVAHKTIYLDNIDIDGLFTEAASRFPITLNKLS